MMTTTGRYQDPWTAHGRRRRDGVFAAGHKSDIKKKRRKVGGGPLLERSKRLLKATGNGGGRSKRERRRGKEQKIGRPSARGTGFSVKERR